MSISSVAKTNRTDLVQRLQFLVDARYPVVWITTREEQRILECLNEINIQETDKPVIIWDFSQSMFIFLEEWKGQEAQAKLPSELSKKLDIVSSIPNLLPIADKVRLAIYPDFHLALANTDDTLCLIRELKRVALQLPYLSDSVLSIFVVSSSGNIPVELRDEIYLEEIGLPNATELENLFRKLVLSEFRGDFKLSDDVMNDLVNAALGLTLNQASKFLLLAIVEDSKTPHFWVNKIMESKKQVIRESRALEYFSPKDCLVSNDLAGLENLKNWLKIRRAAFTQKGKDYGLPSPRGVALIGIPGTGKSMTAKYLASQWEIPLVRLDMGSVFGSLVGESESQIRMALQLVDTVSPCILWLDEMEKSVQTEGLDAGTAARVLGHLLTWMQERQGDVFVVATANDVTKIPPEILRKGRFDEVFALQLPTEKERRDIFKAHLRRFKLQIGQFDLDALVNISEGYVGAEIEQSVKEGMYRAYNRSKGKEYPLTDDILEFFSQTPPLSKSMQESKQWTEMINWIDKRWAVPASRPIRSRSAKVGEKIAIRTRE